MTLFRGFDETFIKLLDVFFFEGNYPSGQAIIQQWQEQDRFFMIVAGEVEVHHEVDSRKVSLGTLCAGHFFGEMNLFDPGLATASVTAMTPVRTLEISNLQFRHFITHRPDLAADFTYQLTETIVKRFRQSNTALMEEISKPDKVRRAQQHDRTPLA